MITKPTDKELKEKLAMEKRQRLVIKGTTNRLLQNFSLKNIQTWGDVYKTVGYDDTYIKSQSNSALGLTYPELKQYCANLEAKFEQGLKDKHEGKQEPIQVSRPKDIQTDVIIDQSKPSVITKTDSQVAHFQPASAIDTVVASSDESGFNNSNDYGLQPSANEEAFLFWFQKKATKEVLDKIVKEKKRAVLVIASTGTGKTYIQGAIDRRLKDIDFHKGKTWGHIPYLAITRNTVVEQTKRVMREQFGIDPVVETEVINIEKLRTRAGQIWIENLQTIINGEEVELWKWKDLIYPVVIYLDECQSVKNPSSAQHKIMVGYSELPINTVQVYISATPFTRVSEAKAFAIATRKDISHMGFPDGTKLTEATWATYSAAIASPSAPDEYNEAAVERLMKDLNEYIVQVKGVRWQFNAINSVEIIDFPSAVERKEYEDAWQKYLARKAALEESVTDNPRFQAMIELGIFLAAAEYAKRYIFAARMFKDVQAGYAAVCAVKFKKTIIAVTKILVEDYGVSRDKISLVWGGGQTQLTAKQKLKAQVNANKEIFEQAGISMSDMLLDNVEDRVLEDLPAELRLGNQSKEARQIEIDRFQSGKSLFCLYTYKAGGVGLSLHHTDEQCNDWNRSVEGFEQWHKELTERNAKAEIFNKGLKERNKALIAQGKWPIAKAQVVKPGKIRRKENGYYVEEDIKYVLTRPRRVTVGPTWSPIELVQGCGRAPRLTSLSNTVQNFLYFRGTVEEEQAFVVTHRLRCLSKVVRQHESWQDLITNHAKAKEIAQGFVKETEHLESDEPQGPIAGNIESDED